MGPVIKPCLWLLIAWGGTTLLAGQHFGQPPGLLSPLSPENDGWHLYNFSANTTFYSVGLPYGVESLPPGTVFQPAWGSGAEAAIGWTEQRERTVAELSYDASYATETGFSGFQAWNQSLSGLWQRVLRARWSFTASVNAGIATRNQYFYAPTAPSEASSLPPTFTGFAGVGNGAFFANPRIVLAEAQNPQPDPLAQTLYGNRVFHTQLAAGLTYQQSERLSWHFFLSALRLESLPVTTSGGDRGEGLIAASTSVSAEMRLRYLWSPRTTLTYDLSEARTLSRVEDVYTTRAIAGIAHALSPHWQAEMHAGESQLSPRWELYPVPAGFGYLAGASLAFQTFGHTFSGSVSRQAGDSYGIGAASTLMSSASWNWRRPGSDWSLRGIFAWQKLRQGAGIEDWTATAAVNRTFGNHLAAQIAYVYLKLSQTTIAGLHPAQSSVRASITWYPQETHR